MKTTGCYNNSDYSARIIFPHHKKNICRHYSELVMSDLDSFCQFSQLPLAFTHFGVEIRFVENIQVELHNENLLLDEGLRQMLDTVGAIVLKNAVMTSRLRDMGHRNRFPHLNFHVDRSANQVTYYSMYTRNPFDDIQIHPRTSSTLFIPAVVGHLQGLREGLVKPQDKGLKGTYTLFTEEDISELSRFLILEHAWDEPYGTGEISMLNNLNLLHASYYRDPVNKGYKIGVRYLA